jgi:hypothetical protein
MLLLTGVEEAANVTHTGNPSTHTWEAETGGLRVSGQPGLQQDCLAQKNKKKKKKMGLGKRREKKRKRRVEQLK